MIVEKLQADLRAAIKGRDTVRTMTIRGVMAEVTRLEKELRRQPNDTEILQIVKRERARRDEAIGFARQAGRPELVAQYEQEAEVLDGYMPQQLGEAELAAAISAEMENGERRLGVIMKTLKERFGARLDGKTASEMVKRLLEQG
jgi:uncharacterized protein YqeY